MPSGLNNALYVVPPHRSVICPVATVLYIAPCSTASLSLNLIITLAPGVLDCRTQSPSNVLPLLNFTDPATVCSAVAVLLSAFFITALTLFSLTLADAAELAASVRITSTVRTTSGVSSSGFDGAMRKSFSVPSTESDNTLISPTSPSVDTETVYSPGKTVIEYFPLSSVSTDELFEINTLALVPLAFMVIITLG
ncbi:Uncharacterised protein [Serratia fonticola]|nr:Uncharacterised protein [Serratia fonticola]